MSLIPNLQLQGKSALVCGSSQGIGKAVAQELAALGAEVILQARNENKLKEVYDQLPRPYQQKHHYVVSDFSQIPHSLSFVDDYQKSNGPISIAVLNSGGPSSGELSEQTSSPFQQAFHQHFFLNHELMKKLLPSMKTLQFGRLLCILSTSVKTPLPHLGVSNCTRAAVASWAKTLSSEVAGWGITVNCLLPGATNTQRLHELIEKKSLKIGRSYAEEEKEWLSSIPMKRFARPEEIAQAAAFLCSPAASYITGVALCVDGGRTVSL